MKCVWGAVCLVGEGRQGEGVAESFCPRPPPPLSPRQRERRGGNPAQANPPAHTYLETRRTLPLLPFRGALAWRGLIY